MLDISIDPTTAKFFSIVDLMKTGHVKRWQIVRVAREQTIAEHMYRVWALVRPMAQTAFRDRIMVSMAEEWALIHDQPEVVTGDLATPTKAAIREAVPHDDPIRRVELSLDAYYGGVYTSLKANWPEVLALVKMADVIEAVAFLRVEGLGRHAAEVETGLKEALVRMQSEYMARWPNYAWEGALAIGIRSWNV
jgi:hypothetical protein